MKLTSFKTESRFAKKKGLTWLTRNWRLADYHLFQYSSKLTDFKKCNLSNAKYTLNLRALQMIDNHIIKFDSNRENILSIRHFDTGELKLKFTDHEIFIAWLKILSAFSAPAQALLGLPSNVSYSLWVSLQAIYKYPKLLTIEGKKYEWFFLSENISKLMFLCFSLKRNISEILQCK